jgi:hypothetical protein
MLNFVFKSKIEFFSFFLNLKFFLFFFIYYLKIKIYLRNSGKLSSINRIIKLKLENLLD